MNEDLTADAHKFRLNGGWKDNYDLGYLDNLYKCDNNFSSTTVSMEIFVKVFGAHRNVKMFPKGKNKI